MPSSRNWYLRENKPSVTICSLSLIIIGILMIFAGGLVTYIYFTEITPPNYDAYYQRYVGSSFPRIFGILILMAGLILFWGASIFLVYVYYRGVSNPQQGRYYFDTSMPTSATTNLEHSTIKENYIG